MENFTIEVPLKFDNPTFVDKVPAVGKYTFSVEVRDIALKEGPKELLTMMILSAAYQIKNDLFREPKKD